MPIMTQELILDSITEGSLVADGGNQHAAIAFFKCADPETSMSQSFTLDNLPETHREVVQELIYELEKQHKDAQEVLRKELSALEQEIASTPEPDQTEEDIYKGLPEIVRTRLQAQDAANADLQKQLQVEKEARLATEFVAKAHANYPNLTDLDDLGIVLKDLHTFNPELALSVEKRLVAANAIASEVAVLTKELGREQQDDAFANSAWAEIQKRANALIDQGIEQNTSVAITKVMDADKNLYNRYLTEQANRPANSRR